MYVRFIYLFSIKPSPNNPDIFKFTSLYYTKMKIEIPHPKMLFLSVFVAKKMATPELIAIIVFVINSKDGSP